MLKTLGPALLRNKAVRGIVVAAVATAAAKAGVPITQAHLEQAIASWPELAQIGGMLYALVHSILDAGKARPAAEAPKAG